MRRLIFVVLFMILTMSMLFGEGLGTNAQNLRKVSPEGYEIIKARAIDEWGTDHSMVLFAINNQSDSLREVMLLLFDGGDLKIFAYVVANWSFWGTVLKNAKKIAEYKKTGNISDLYTIAADWSMVLFEYEYQMTAASSY